jgi:hypothetical protein
MRNQTRASPKDGAGNLILDALSGDQVDRVMAHAEKRGIDVGVQLIAPESPIELVFFPTQGTLSVLAVPEEDRRVGAATIGREGAADVFAALGSQIAVHELIGQVPGEMIVIDSQTVIREASSPVLPGPELRLHPGFFAQTAFGPACNAVHHINSRAARWLLMTHDRMDEDTFLLRQEFLAFMLGVHRPTVSIAAGALKNAGFIDFSRSVVTVKDRFGLEEAASPCYENVRTTFSRLVQL